MLDYVASWFSRIAFTDKLSLIESRTGKSGDANPIRTRDDQDRRNGKWKMSFAGESACGGCGARRARCNRTKGTEVG